MEAESRNVGNVNGHGLAPSPAGLAAIAAKFFAVGEFHDLLHGVLIGGEAVNPLIVHNQRERAPG